MAPVTVLANSRNSYYSAGNIGWSATSAFAYRTHLQQLIGTAATSFGNTVATERFAQSFTPTANVSLTEFMVAIFKAGTPTDNLSLAVYAETTDAPGTLIATAANVYTGANISTSASWLEFGFSTPVALTSGTKYWFALYRSGAVDGTNYYRIMRTTTSAYAGHGSTYYDTGAWSGFVDPDVDVAFQLKVVTPSALYQLAQDTGVSPKLRMFKSTNDGVSWSEVDSANAPSVNAGTAPFDGCDTRSGPYIGAAYFIDADSIRMRAFNMSSDTWGGDLQSADATGAVTASQERSIRVAIDNRFVTASHGSQYIQFTSLADDADLGFTTRSTIAWTANATAVFSGNTTEASLNSAVVVDKAPHGYVHRFYYDPVGDDYTMISVNFGTTGIATDIEAAATSTETGHISACYQIYQNGSGVDTIVAAYMDNLSVKERILTLEATSASVAMAAEAETNINTGAAGRQVSTCSFNGTRYVAANVSGAVFQYSTSTVAGTWSSASNFKTGLTSATLSNVLSIEGYGLLVSYTDNGDTKVDWIVAPSGGSTPVNDTDTIAPTLSEADTLAAAIPDTETIAPTLTEVEAVSKVTSDTETIAPTLSEADTVAVALSDTDTIAPTLTEAEAISITKDDTDTIAPTLSEAETLTAAIPETETIAPTLSEVEAVSKLTNDADTIAPTIAEAESLAATASDAESITPTLSEADTVARTGSDTDTLAPTLTEVDTVAITAVDVDTIAPTLAEVDSATITLSDTETVAPGLSEADSVAAVLSDTETIAPTLSESESYSEGVTPKDDTETISPTLAEVDTVTVAVTDSDTISPTLTEVENTAQAHNDADTISPTLTEAETLTAAISEAETIAPILGEGDALTAALSETDTIAPVLSELEIVGQSKSDTDTIAPTLSEVESYDDGVTLVNDSDTIAPTLSEAETLTATAAETETIAPTLTESESVLKEIPKNDTDTIAPTLSETELLAAAIADADTIAAIITELEAAAAILSDGDALLVVLSETDSAAVFLSDIETLTAILAIDESKTSYTYGFDPARVIRAGRGYAIVYAGRPGTPRLAGGPDSILAIEAGRELDNIDGGRSGGPQTAEGGRNVF
jgi:hypothetical protein